ncbi:DUF389 domain-containing protein [Winogradskyella aurantiaca]|uniref:DUF389 domain-containing protein n=1 Tax=Winogradskyella aurantiaca TaxID=2219558 RepID=UPI000E1D3354|nr:DUF389 domain-containing protein [Winogradskyella aurantiaca]
MEENKFNFSEETPDEIQDKKVAESKKAIKEDAKELATNVRGFLSELLDFRHDTDREQTIAAIKADIPFKGATAWILICSIFVASIGLNANSTAVVIGAMLISPLMGPILGIGLSVAVNDIDTLRKSLINFGVMILLSVLTAFLFFWLFPLSDDSSELLARTRPDIRDVLIAFFGGLALIIARTKKGTIASVIFGVAIATALMPPLCTVGFGLSYALQDNFDTGIRFAAGAMYLFTINTIFIALATFLTVKILKFPMLKYANSKRRRFISRVATVLAIIAMVPAIWTFVDVLRESNFYRDAERFMDKELKELATIEIGNYEYLKRNTVAVYQDKDNKYIEINSYGLDDIKESTISILESRMQDYPALQNARLFVNQDMDPQQDQMKYIQQLRIRDSIELVNNANRIKLLESQALELANYRRLEIPFNEVAEEARINYKDIENFSFYNRLSTNFSKTDTIPVVVIKWNEKMKRKVFKEDSEKVEAWLKYKLKMDKLVVSHVR